jgi:WD40 repeat protein
MAEEEKILDQEKETESKLNLKKVKKDKESLRKYFNVMLNKKVKIITNEILSSKEIKNIRFNKFLFKDDIPLMKMFVEKIKNEKQNDEFKKKLFGMVEASKTSNEVSIAASNAMTILNLLNVSFIGMDFRNVKIGGALLDQAFLDETDFSGADLSNVSLTQTSLSNAKFVNANMKGVNFGESACFKGHTFFVNDVKYSPNGKLIASCSWDKSVRLWEIESGKELFKYEGHNDWARCVCFSPNGEIVCIRKWR